MVLRLPRVTAAVALLTESATPVETGLGAWFASPRYWAVRVWVPTGREALDTAEPVTVLTSTDATHPWPSLNRIVPFPPAGETVAATITGSPKWEGFGVTVVTETVVGALLTVSATPAETGLGA
jgi:hypothetical protein